MRRITYDVPDRGLATDFTEVEVPLRYAQRFRNRYINRLGGAEKRRGVATFGDMLPNTSTVTGVHELVSPVGEATLLVSAEGEIYRYDDPGWTLVHTMEISNARLRSVQMRDKLIFFNGVDRQVFTEDGSTFKELRALLEVGLAGSDTSATRLDNADITDWTTGTDVSVNDVVFYPTLGKADIFTGELNGAYAVVVGVSASAVTTTAVSADATGLGDSPTEPTTSTPFEIIDLVPLDMFDNGVELDNTAIAGAGTTQFAVAVSGVTWADTDVRRGDFIRNTTRASVVKVTSIASATLAHAKVSGQIAGDSLVFLKSAMPVSYHTHIHYDRAYYVDARDRRRMVVSAPYDPQGVNSEGGSLDDISFFSGALQPRGDVIVSLGSYQGFFVIGGEHAVYLYSGTQPVGSGSNFIPVALFPQGVISQDGILNIGNDLLFISHDGLQSASQINDASQLGRDTLTFPISDTLRDQLDAVSSREEIILTHYRQRSWVLLKVGDQMYVYNYATKPEEQQQVGAINLAQYGSISQFDGLFAQSAAFLERRDDSLICGGVGGKVYVFDNDSQYTDDGVVYTTELETGWLLLDDARKKGVEIKSLKYIEPTFESNANIVYEITGLGGFDFDSSDTVNVAASAESSLVGSSIIPFTIGGSPISSKKHTLRVRGEAVRVRFATADALGPDTISRYTLFAAVHGAV